MNSRQTVVYDRRTAAFEDDISIARRAAPKARFRPVRSLFSGVEWLFGLACVLVGLAFLSAVPILQFLCLGYLLEAGARVAKSGRVRDGFIGVRTAARIGGMVLGCWLFLLPVRFVSDLAYSATIIDPTGHAAQVWRRRLFVLMVFTLIHLIAACARGGKLRYFLWPLNFVWLIRRLLRGGYYAEARDAVWQQVVDFRLRHYFTLGVRGFVAAVAWLVVPVSLIALGRAGTPLATLLGFVGALLLAIVLLYLPFLQLRVAIENRLSAAWDVGSVRRAYQRAPWAFVASLIATLLFALPLYLLKIEVVPREAAWLPGVVFMLFIFPARLLTGWAMGRAARRETRRHFVFRWTGRLPMLPVAALYVLIVFFSQYTSWNGVWSLYEQHAFLVPVPFLVL